MKALGSVQKVPPARKALSDPPIHRASPANAGPQVHRGHRANVVPRANRARQVPRVHAGMTGPVVNKVQRDRQASLTVPIKPVVAGIGFDAAVEGDAVSSAVTVVTCFPPLVSGEYCHQRDNMGMRGAWWGKSGAYFLL